MEHIRRITEDLNLYEIISFYLTFSSGGLIIGNKSFGERL